MEIRKLNLVEYVDAIKNKTFSAEKGVREFIAAIKADHRNAVLETFEATAIEQAQLIDKRLKSGEKLGRLAGAPILIKDNILFKNHKATCASKMLENFVAPYTSTVVEKMLAEDAIIIGRANMDQFAMGTTGETSAWGATLNAHSDQHVGGGSSSGSAVAVAANLCVAALGTDTGGSIRCPAAWNGLYSIKPTYGTVSRFGVVAFASSLDQVGPICKTVDDANLLLDVIRGKCENDATSIAYSVRRPSGDACVRHIKSATASTPACTPERTSASTGHLRIGYVPQVWKHCDKIVGFDKFQQLFETLKSHGHEIVNVDIKNIDLGLATYYVIAPAEAASNLARFDGVRYTSAPDAPNDLTDLYKKTRTNYFGDEVKRRINLGNYVLSSGYFDAYYGKAKAVQAALKGEFKTAFEKCDVIIIPTTPDDAPKLKTGITDPLANYLIDLFTVVANITGIPALSMPFDRGSHGLPIGLQILGAPMHEETLVNASKIVATLGGVK